MEGIWVSDLEPSFTYVGSLPRKTTDTTPQRANMTIRDYYTSARRMAYIAVMTSLTPIEKGNIRIV